MHGTCIVSVEKHLVLCLDRWSVRPSMVENGSYMRMSVPALFSDDSERAGRPLEWNVEFNKAYNVYSATSRSQEWFVLVHLCFITTTLYAERTCVTETLLYREPSARRSYRSKEPGHWSYGPRTTDQGTETDTSHLDKYLSRSTDQRNTYTANHQACLTCQFF